jgi:lysozyme
VTTLKERIKRHEGCVLTPYKDSLGVLTVGYGRNLEAVPFSQNEVELMLENDLKKAERLASSFAVYDSLSETRKGVLIEMVYQMGRAGVFKFKKFLAAAAAKDWQAAHDEMLDSQWAKQTPKRAKELAEIFLNG